ncbi:hypothetical protein ACFT8P_05360 [Streptomyces sp. NPDC057101]|uniref:hypothetical protein n=1 Tax=Streptomyces sp. NPDC057101 TaxID=3346020 RepID=UPI0036402738
MDRANNAADVASRALRGLVGTDKNNFSGTGYDSLAAPRWDGMPPIACQARSAALANAAAGHVATELGCTDTRLVEGVPTAVRP